MTVRERLGRGDFNYMSQHVEPDGSTLVTLTKHGDPRIYRMWATGLYTAQERVIREEIKEA